MSGQYCIHLKKYGISAIAGGLSEKRAKEVKDYSWLCHPCGTLWTGFQRKSYLDDAVQELSDGQRMFPDWEQIPVQSGLLKKIPVAGIRVWKHPEKTGAAYTRMVGAVELREFFNVIISDRYKKEQDACETKLLYNLKDNREFNNLLDKMPIRGKIPGMYAEPDFYSANVAFKWYWVLDFLRGSHVKFPPTLESLADGVGCIGEMGPRTPKGPFPTSQVMFALAVNGFRGTYVPLDYAEWPISSLLGTYEWFRREHLLKYEFGKIRGTDWTNMGKEFKEVFDILFASHFVEDFIFGWYFRQCQPREDNRENGYNHYPYDEMYHKSQRAKVHWLRLMEEIITGQAFRHKYMEDLQVIVDQMYQSINPRGFLATWHYPAYRLLHAGLHEEATFEMWLYSEAVKLMQKKGLKQIPLTDLSDCSKMANPTEIPFSHSVRILRSLE